MARHGRVLKDSACVAIADNAENIEHADGRRASPDIERGAARIRSNNRTVTQRACRALVEAPSRLVDAGTKRWHRRRR